MQAACSGNESNRKGKYCSDSANSDEGRYIHQDEWALSSGLLSAFCRRYCRIAMSIVLKMQRLSCWNDWVIFLQPCR